MNQFLLQLKNVLKSTVAIIVFTLMVPRVTFAQVTISNITIGDFINGNPSATATLVLNGASGTGPTYYKPSGNLQGLTTDGADNIAFIEASPARIMRIDGTHIITFPAIASMDALAVDHDNEFIYAASHGTPNTINRYVWKSAGTTSMGYYVGSALGTVTTAVKSIPFITSGDLVFMNGAATTTALNLGKITLSMAFDASGNMYYGDNTNNVVRKVSIEKATPTATVSGATTITLSAAPSAAVKVGDEVSGLNIPATTYITAISGTAITLSKATTGAIDNSSTLAIITGVSDIAGTFGTAGTTLGATAATTVLQAIFGLTIDPSGNLFVNDQNNINPRILKISAPVSSASAIAVFGSGYSNRIQGMATDVNGNLYLADKSFQRVLKIGAGGGGAVNIVGSGNNVILSAYNVTAGSPVVTTTDLADLLKMDVGMTIRGTGIPAGTTVTVINTQTSPYSLTLSNPGGTTVGTPDGTAALGSTTLTVTSSSGITAGNYVVGAGIPANTTVASITGTTVTLSAATTAPLAVTQLFFFASSVYNTVSPFTSSNSSSENNFTTANGAYGYVENIWGLAVSHDANNPYIVYDENFENYVRKISGSSISTATAIPTITSFTPTTTSAGATVTITGTNFTGATNVNFGGVDAASFTVVSPTSITAVVGTGTNGVVFVTTPAGTAFSASSIKITPTITSFTPTTGVAGTTVTITGTNFLTGTPTVTFGGTAVAAASVTINNNTTITVVTGTGSGGKIAVTTSSGTATSTGSFTFISAPTSLSYAAAPPANYGTAGTSGAPILATPNVLTYTISPTPPAGISIDANTGIISYANTIVPGSYPFTVTATNTLGSISTAYTLTVNAVAPTALVYSTASSTAIRGTAGTSVAPTVNNGGATVAYSLTGTVPGNITINPTTGVISYDNALPVGTYSLTVTATNVTGSTNVTYTININPSPDNNLSNLSISTGTLTPAFNSATISYVVGVPISTTSVIFTPTVSDAFASVQVNGIAVASGSPSSAVALLSGANNISIVVTAQDGTTKTYTVNVIQSSLSNIAQLSTLVLSSGTLSPVFASATTDYTASVANATTSITVTPTLANASATQTVNGSNVSNGAPSSPIALNVGSNIINTVVKAQDGVTVVTYSVNVNRAASANNNLSGLSISSSSLSPTFSPATLNYTATVVNSVSTISFTPIVADATATVTVNGVAVTSGSASTGILLNVGANTLTISVTAQNGSVNNYTVVVKKLGLPQTITFAPLNAVIYGSADIAAGATSTNSTVPLTYSSSNTGVATVASDGTIHILNAGSTDITVSQASNTVFDPATPVLQTLKVNPAALTITANNQTKVFGAANPTLTVTYAGFVNGDNATKLTNQPSVTTTATIASGVNTYPITASGASSPNYAISYVPGVLTITGGARTITFAALANKTYGDADFPLTATISSGETAIYASSDPTIATVTNGTVHIVTAGTITITASAPVNGNYTTTATVSQTLIINKASQTINFAAIPTQLKGGSYQLNATASTGLPITFTSSDTKVASINGQNADLLAAGLTAITAIQAGNINYLSATASQFLKVQDGLVTVHTGLSPNGDGINDYLLIDGISNYPDNKLTIVDKNGAKVFQTSNYDNVSNNFTGQSNSGVALQPGTYFYELELKVNGESKRQAGYIVLKYN